MARNTVCQGCVSPGRGGGGARRSSLSQLTLVLSVGPSFLPRMDEKAPEALGELGVRQEAATSSQVGAPLGSPCPTLALWGGGVMGRGLNTCALSKR